MKKTIVTFDSLSVMAKAVDFFINSATIEFLIDNGYSIDKWYNKYGYNRRYINKYDDKGNKVQVGYFQINDDKQEIELALNPENVGENELVLEVFKGNCKLKELVK